LLSSWPSLASMPIALATTSEEAQMGDERQANESVEDYNERVNREIEALCRADPNCDYDDGDGDGEHFTFFDNHIEHVKGDKRTMKRAIVRK
jgi:hypothetical protein